MENLHYIQMKEHKNLDLLLNNGIIFKLYEDCFKDPPYEESFTPGEINSLFLDYLEKGILMFCTQENKENIIGFVAAIPLKYETEIASLAKNYGYDPSNDWYYADIGVAKEFRGNKIGRHLAQEIIKLIPANKIIMRTQEKNIASLSCHKEIGFKVIDGMQQSVKKERTSGIKVEDKRIFLYYNKESVGE